MSALITPAELEARLGAGDVRVLESSIDRASYEAAHVPGALWVDHFADLLRNGDDSAGYVLTAGQFAALMSRLGIALGTTVVWYGDRHSSYAIRGFWTMEYWRHPAPVYVLDGGRERWLREGRPVRSGDDTATPAAYPIPAVADEADHATLEQVRDAIGEASTVILDVRSSEEHDGTNRRAKRGGHIPGAVNIEWTDATVEANVLKPAEELRAMYAARGATPDKEIIAHCQLGVRAAHTWFVLKHVLGYPNVRNYDGSWAEWGNQDDVPVESAGAGERDQ